MRVCIPVHHPRGDRHLTEDHQGVRHTSENALSVRHMCCARLIFCLAIVHDQGSRKAGMPVPELAQGLKCILTDAYLPTYRPQPIVTYIIVLLRLECFSKVRGCIAGVKQDIPSLSRDIVSKKGHRKDMDSLNGGGMHLESSIPLISPCVNVLGFPMS